MQTPLLKDWQRQNYPVLKSLTYNQPDNSIANNLTILAYFFWDEKPTESELWRIKFSFLSAFRVLGLAKSVLVVNQTTPEIQEFCERYRVEIQIEPNLTDIKAMCADCCGKLHSRFHTNYVLIIQSDGIIINRGIENFIGKYDYIGAPWSGHTTYYDLFPYPKFGVGNGGLSLRSKRITIAASKYWNALFKYLPYNFFTIEDNFYCKTLSLFPSWRIRFNFPSIHESANFSIESLLTHPANLPPIGFHSNVGFTNYCRLYGIPNFNKQ